MSRQLVEAGKVMEIPVYDSLIVGYDGTYRSLAESGQLQ